MPYPYEDERRKTALPQAPIAPPKPAPFAVAPTTKVGRGGIAAPVLQAGHGRGAAADPTQVQKISGAAPALVPAAQAATPVGAPLVEAQPRPLSRTAEGVFPYAFGQGGGQQGFAFRDPLTGQERGFGTQEQAQAALTAGTAGTPGAVTAARNDILQRAQQGALSTGSIPAGAFNQQEQALMPGLAKQVSLPAPSLSAPKDAGQAPGPADIIRGNQVSSGGGTGAGGGSPADLFREQLAASIQAGAEHGADMRQYLPQIEMLSKIEKNGAAALKASLGALPTLSQVQGQRFMDLAQNPGGITEADKLVFGKGGQGAGLKLYEHPIYDQYGAQSGTTPFLYDDKTGKAQEMQLSGAPGSQGGKTGSASGTQGGQGGGVPQADGLYHVPGHDGPVLVIGGRPFDPKTGKPIE